MDKEIIILWHYRDLRLADHPALTAAIAQDVALVPLYIEDPEAAGNWRTGLASCWWLYHALEELATSYRDQLGCRLLLRRGDAEAVWTALLQEMKGRGVSLRAVYWVERYEPSLRCRDEKLQSRLEAEGVAVRRFLGNYLLSPDQLFTKQGNVYRLFTPFYKALSADWPSQVARPSPSPKRERLQAVSLPEGSLAQLELLSPSAIAETERFSHSWKPTRSAGLALLESLAEEKLATYEAARDFCGQEGTSRLSPYLHFGQLSIRELFWRLWNKPTASPFLRQLVWREFANYLLYHFPHFAENNWRPLFDQFPWTQQSPLLEAWQRGQTGYPLVDAGMRQLQQTGWLHNRVRMVCSSFLVKHLLIDWRAGARWFWETLVDADLANNSLGWQWVAGSGPDAAPYFRIFHPTRQSEKFDPEGIYLRRYLPELAQLPNRWIHEPAAAPPQLLEGAGVLLGQNYPYPIVHHPMARERALAAYYHLSKLA